MIRLKLVAIVLLFIGVNCTYTEPVKDEFTINSMFNDWGPYTERYAGISHIADKKRGLRFDLSAFPVTPGTRNLPFANAGHSSVFTYWAARPRLEDYTIRFIMDSDRKAWCDISYFERDKSSRLLRIDMHNESGRVWEGDFHLLAHLRHPPKDYFSRIGNESLRCATVDLPDGAVWVRSLDYKGLTLASPDKLDALPERGRGHLGGHLSLETPSMRRWLATCSSGPRQAGRDVGRVKRRMPLLEFPSASSGDVALTDVTAPEYA